MYKYATAIGIDIGRTKLSTAIVRLDGRVYDTYDYPYDKHPDRNALIKHIIDAIRDRREKSISLDVNPLCVGVSGKGFINRQKGVVVGPEQGIKGWANVALADEIKRSIGLPAFIDNDANLMAVAESSFGAGASFKNMIFVTLRSGIGGAIIIDGKLYRGVNNAAGEFGQMIINGSKTLESLASSVALVRSYLKKSGKKDSPFKLEPKAKDVFELALKGDPVALEAIKENAGYIGKGLANIISVFSPEVIVLGGGMSQAGGDYLDLIRESAWTGSHAYYGEEVRIERASLGLKGAVIGASLYALTRLDGKDL